MGKFLWLDAGVDDSPTELDMTRTQQTCGGYMVLMLRKIEDEQNFTTELWDLSVLLVWRLFLLEVGTGVNGWMVVQLTSSMENTEM